MAENPMTPAATVARGVVAAAALAVTATVADACSRVLWAPEDGNVLVGRTQDWTEQVGSKLRKFPRGQERVSPGVENPLSWTSQYGSLANIGYDLGTHEGVNERGLSAHILYLAGAAEFGERNPSVAGLSITQWAQYVLDNFATVSEAVAAFEEAEFQVVPLILPNGKSTQFHLSIQDATGDSAVFEYVNGGELKIYHDRRYTVMTNEPTYDQQIENLKQYRSFGGDRPLPGERTPADRFVRAAYYVNALPAPANADEAAAFMFSVIRNVSVPFGAADPDRPNVSNTIFRSVIDLTTQRYFFESTFAPNVVWVDYNELDFGADSGELELKVEERIFSLSGDVTGDLAPSEPFEFGGG